MQQNRPQVVIVGAGFGGLAAARALSGADVDITVVDQRNHHTFQPLLYQVATAGLGVDDICYATRGIFHRQSNARALQARLERLDTERKLVYLDGGTELSYDYLVLALGAVTADYGVPGVSEHSFGLKSADEARRIRMHVLKQFESAERLEDADERAAAMTIVIAGGGPTGVEMAGGFAELFHRVLRRDFPSLDLDRARVVLVEGRDRLLGAFASELGDRAERRLEWMGVEIRTGVNVARAERDRVVLDDGTEIRSNTLVWAAGVRAHPLAEALGLETIRNGRVVVDEHLRVAGLEDVFALGDLAASIGPDGELLPQVAPVAIQGGRHVAGVIEDAIHDSSTRAPFRYRDKGSMATIGRNAAVVELPRGLRLTGLVGWVAWLVLHLVMLIGFRNRANVLVNWAWNYLTYDRGSRLIIEADVDESSRGAGRTRDRRR